MLNPSSHIFRKWTPLPFSVHEDIGLEVGKEIIRKIAGALGHPMPVAPSSKDSREMMMDKLWRTHGLDEVEKRECGPQLKKCLHDVIKDLGHLNEADAKEQITIQMTKTMHQDPPPHYSTQDSKLIRHTIAGLLGSASDDFRNEWNEQADPHIVVGDQITGDHLENCDCEVEIIMKPPLIILWKRRLLDSPLPTNQDHRPRPKRKLTSHRENDKPP
jgi:hypothetical protein